MSQRREKLKELETKKDLYLEKTSNAFYNGPEEDEIRYSNLAMELNRQIADLHYEISKETV